MKRWPKKPTQEESGPQRSVSVPARKQIGTMLVEEGLITPHQLERAVSVQAHKGGKIVETLINLGHLERTTFTRFLARQPGIGSIDLTNYEIPWDLVSTVPRDFAVQHEVLPIDKLGRLLTLGMACPLDATTIQELERQTGLRIKPLLCSPDAIRKAINRYYGADYIHATSREEPVPTDFVRGIESPLKLSHVATLLRRINSLPALPETVQRAREAMKDPSSSVRAVANIITLDPPVAAKVLSVANSAAYGFPQRINDIALAVSLLGLRETYSILLSVAVIDLFKVSKHFNYRAFWRGSMSCAAACRIIAKVVSQSKRPGLLAAGLLHDIGQVALAEVAPELYATVDQDARGEELIAEEEIVVGLAHPEAGYELATHWGLPPEIKEPIRFHHHPHLATQAEEAVHIVALASAMSDVTEASVEENQDLFESQEQVMGKLGLDRETVEGALRDFLVAREQALKDPFI